MWFLYGYRREWCGVDTDQQQILAFAACRQLIGICIDIMLN